MDRTAVVISIRTQPGRRDEVRSVWERRLRARVEASAAQQAYVLVEDAAERDVLHLFEVYDDSAEMARNRDAPWFADYLAEAGPLLGRRHQAELPRQGCARPPFHGPSRPASPT